MRRMIALTALTSAFCLALLSVAHAYSGSVANDNARFLAGIKPDAGSPLAALADGAAFKEHARAFDASWKELEDRQLAKVRAWSTANLRSPRATLFYMFSGPDYLYANALFPEAATYVLSGLEPVGKLPDVTSLKGKALDTALGQLRASLKQLLSHSYFITSEMDNQLRSGRMSGTLPVLYVFLARSGKTIREVSYVKLEADGSLKPFDEATDGTPRAVKIVFSGADGRERTLYFFSTDLSNKGTASSGFLAFCGKLAPGDAFVKSASYLMHGSDFASVREFLLANSAMILQDDTGIPVRDFKADRWELQPFGNYTGPIPQFSGSYQKRLAELFQKVKPGPMDFGLGYKWRPGRSHLMRATRKDLRAAQ